MTLTAAARAQHQQGQRCGARMAIYSRINFEIKNSGYINKNKFGSHQVSSVSPESVQKETACSPDTLVSTNEINAILCQCLFCFACK
jgi:hypothetical protein